MNTQKTLKTFGLSTIMLLLALLVFTSCSSDDGEKTKSYDFQTEADKQLESSLMGSKWVLTRTVSWDENGQIRRERSDEDEDWVQKTIFLSSEKPLVDTSNKYAHILYTYVNGKSYNDGIWAVFADGLVWFDNCAIGKILSYTNSELIISTYKQTIFGNLYEDGATWYFKKVNVDDNNDTEQGLSSEHVTWENGVLKNGTNAQPYLGSWLYTYYLDYDGDRWVKNILYVFNDDNTYELHTRYVGTENKYNISKGTYRVSGDKLYLTEGNKTEKSKKLSGVSREMLSISGDHYYPTTLTTLDDNASVDIRETPVICKHYFDNKVYPNIVIAPKWGINHYTYSVDNGEEIEVSGKKGIDKVFKNFDFGTTHTYKIKAYSKGGKQFPTVKGNFTVPGLQGLVNFFTYNGIVYPIQKVEMQTKHASASSGANFKYLRMFYSDDTFLQFQYANPSWDGIDKTWASGTYKIAKESNEYYKYACLIKIEGSFKEHPEGKLIIKSGSNGSITYDIDLDICRGHFSGKVK